MMAAEDVLVYSIAYLSGETKEWRVALVLQGSIMVSASGETNRSVSAYLASAVF